MRPSNRILTLLGALALAATVSDAHAQMMSTRRMAMGGVQLMHGGTGSDPVNVAYRAVPRESGSDMHSFSLPVGVIPLLQDPPSTDPDDSTFSAWELANLGLHAPWNIALHPPAEPEGDITITIARDELVVDLGSLRTSIPQDDLTLGASLRAPAFLWGVGRGFVGVAPLLNVRDEFSLGASLRAALRDAQPFERNTDYDFSNRFTGQAAGQLMVGAAFPIVGGRGDDRNGLYVGARAKVLRGLGYADVDARAAFSTGDTLFGSQPIDLGYTARSRYAEPSDGGWGRGLDAGVVLVQGPFTIGLAANDIGSRIDWKVKETVTSLDAVTGNYTTITVAEDVAYTSEVPESWVLTASTRLGPVLVAADAFRDDHDELTGHAGAELWTGPIALRAGASLDARQRVQVAGGVGLKLGPIALDVAVATHQQNLAEERELDLGIGFSLIPGRSH
ncbi:MAG: DUF5723 family protein [bacterium]